MDDQRIEEIAKRHEDRLIDGDHACPADAIAAAIREALSSQEEELRALRETCAQAIANTEEALRQLRERDEQLDSVLTTLTDAVGLAESAEAELLRLRDGLVWIREETAYRAGHSRFAFQLLAKVKSLLASPVQEKVADVQS
jgi:hypothetical protein